VLDRGHHFARCSLVAGELVRDQDTRHTGLALLQLAEQTLGGPFVAPPLDQNIGAKPSGSTARQS